MSGGFDHVEVIEDHYIVEVGDVRDIVIIEDRVVEVVEVAQQGPPGPAGGGEAGADKNYVFNLTGESDVVVTHNLGKFPSVTIFDSSGNEIQGDYQFLDTLRTRLIFSAGFSGKAIFN